MNSVTFSLIMGSIALLTFGISNSLIKRPCQKISYRHFIVYKGIFLSLFLFIVLSFTWKSQNFNLNFILLSLLLAPLGYIGMSFFYKAIEIGKIGIITPIASTTIVFTTFLTVIFLGASISFPQVIAILIILIGLIFIKFNFKDVKNSFTVRSIPGFSEAILHTIFMGLSLFISQIPNNILGFILYPLTAEIGMTLIGWSYIKYKKEKLSVLDKKTFMLCFFIGFLLTIGVLAQFSGLKYGNPIIVFPLYHSSPIIVALFGWFYYKERLHPQQYLAIAAIIVGAIILRLFS